MAGRWEKLIFSKSRRHFMEKRTSRVNGEDASFSGSGCRSGEENPENKEEEDFYPKTVKRPRNFFFARTPRSLPCGCFEK